jgi:twinkle protein
MDIQDFARKYLQPFHISGDEIIPDICPFCKGGGKKDRGTFALNMENQTYNCKRSTCGRSGTFWALCKEFGEECTEPHRGQADYRPRTYVPPKTPIQTRTSQAGEYLRSRGISTATQDSYHVGSDESGNIIFPFYEDGKIIFQKFRSVADKKIWRDPGCKPILFGMDLCGFDKPLVIFEGEIDALSGQEAGIPNSASVPSGASDYTWIDTCWDWLHKFESIYLFGDSDEPGREMVRKTAVRLSDMRVYDVVHACKDANELLQQQGRDAVALAYAEAKEILPHGIIELTDVKPLDIMKIPSCQSGIKELDRLTGGFIMGDLSVWTGKRGEGKSTLLGQLTIEAVQAGHRVCAYSGELRADRFQYWINLQAAGREHIKSYQDTANDREVFYVDRKVLDQIRAWYRHRYWLYDNTINEANEEKSIMQVFEVAAKRYGCTVFLVDNLMTCNYADGSDDDYYRAQSAFTGRLVDFARLYEAHVHLIAHPRKGKPGAKIDNDDVSGLGDITNRAANVFLLARVPEKDRVTVGYDCMLKILKNRWEGVIEKKIGLDYCPTSRRLFEHKTGDVRQYGWAGDFIETDEDLPF